MMPNGPKAMGSYAIALDNGYTRGLAKRPAVLTPNNFSYFAFLIRNSQKMAYIMTTLSIECTFKRVMTWAKVT